MNANYAPIAINTIIYVGIMSKTIIHFSYN